MTKYTLSLQSGTQLKCSLLDSNEMETMSLRKPTLELSSENGEKLTKIDSTNFMNSISKVFTKPNSGDDNDSYQGNIMSKSILILPDINILP